MSRYALTIGLIFAVLLLSAVSFAGTVDDGWAELHKLNVGAAKQLFQAAIKENPADESAKRGLLIAADLDMDHLAATEAVKLMGSQPGDPYLPAVFEWWAAVDKEWGDYESGERQIISLIGKSTYGGHRYLADRMNQSLAFRVAFKPIALKDYSGFRGCWVIGPFDNKSDIAFFRELPIETAPFDTTATVSGAMGVRTGWCWLDAAPDGHVVPSFPFDGDNENVTLMKVPFDLPADGEIVILLGGVYSSRVRLDGTLIQTDPTFRNANIRSGFRLKARKGLHDLTLTVGDGGRGANVRVEIRNADFTPIKGLLWPRYAAVAPDPTIQATLFHPIFDHYDSLTALTPSTEQRFWRGILRMYNGYTNEAVTEYESALAAGELTPLESYLLIGMLAQQENAVRGNEVLSTIATTACPMIAMQWVRQTAATGADQVEQIEKLLTQYPNRVELEGIANVGKLLRGDVQGYKQGLLDLIKKYPHAAVLHKLTEQFYQTINRDLVSAHQEYYEYCRKTSQGANYTASMAGYYMRMQKYPEAIAAVRDLLKVTPMFIEFYNMMVDAALEAHTPQAVLPDLLALADRYPYCTSAYNLLYRVYRQMGEEAKARAALLKIHAIKSAAPTPYMRLEELRNNATLDSLFGNFNADSLWAYTPTAEQLGGQKQWMLLDRTQKLVYDLGPCCRDLHSIRVLEDNEAVQAFQEVDNPVDENDSFNQLLIARRLRKGQPPLNGENNEGKIVFKDLRPGDAIEIRFRQWTNNSGDLWNEFTDNYECNFGLYQRYWEYKVITDRKDIVTTGIPPAPEPIIDTWCGFTRYSWSTDHAKAYQLGLDMLPPTGDLVGRIVLSTIPNWQKLNAWYYSVSEAILNDNPRAKELAHTLTSGISDPRERARALFRFVSMEIPYQTIDFNYDASIPQKPDEVLTRRWGDCKDKAHLFIAMAREAGIPAWPVLVLTDENQTTMPLPQFDFNHLIAACQLGNDTQYVDLTASYYPFERTITNSLSDQPCLPVTASTNAELIHLPPMRIEEFGLTDTMEIWITDQPAAHFESRRTYLEQNAGRRRTTIYGWTPESAREQLQTAASDAWKVALTLDSIHMDTAASIDPIYHETWWGNVTLSKQQVSNMTLLNLPDWSPYSDGLFTSLYWNGKRDFPVTRRWEMRNSMWSFRIHIPASMGTPKPSKPIALEYENCSFKYASAWDKPSRTLTINYHLIMKDGLGDVEPFAAFARKVKECFDSPVVLDAN